MEKNSLQIVMKSINAIKPYDKNPRKNDEAVDYVANSIRQFGFKVPIVIDRDGVIVAGHTRYKASKKLGITEVPCIVADDLSEEQIKAFRLADNKVSEFAEWDDDLLRLEMDDIIGIDMEDFGFDFAGEEEQADVSEDDFDGDTSDAEKNCGVQVGDIWKLGEHRLMCGDSTDIACWDRLMNDNLANMVFTDPPYNVAIGDKNKFLNEQNGGKAIERNLIGDAGMTDEECGERLWLPAFKCLRNVSRDDCPIYVTMPQGGTHMMMMMMMMHEAGWQVKHELIWVKNSPTFSMGRLNYDYQHEPILYGWNKSHVWYGNGKFKKSIWEIDKPKKCDLHPTMKPVELVANAILNSSQEGDIVCDAFGGSGTTLIACEELGRKARLMELDPVYCQVIINRWEALTGDKAERI